MKKINNYVFFMALIGLAILLLDMNVYSYIKSNGAGRGYVETGSIADISNNSIEALIIQGAGNYFSARSNIDTLLKMVELQDIQGLDTNVFTGEIDNAVTGMKNALQTYETLIKEAELTPYNETVVAKLKDFNYESFMISNGLVKDVFGEVENFLSNGDITGALKKTHTDFSQILMLLQNVKSELSSNRMADISVFWRLNETCARSDIFGSYVARIFSVLL
jgi:hypothetical protein